MFTLPLIPSDLYLRHQSSGGLLFLKLSFYFERDVYVQKLSLEREVEQIVNDMIQKEGWTRSYALSVLRSKFESEERNQEVEYIDNLIRKESEEREQEEELAPTAATTTTTTEAEETPTTTNEPAVTATTTSSMKPSPTQEQKQERQETLSSKSVSKQLDRQTIQINKKIAQMLQPLQKHIKSADKQSQLTKQIQTQLKQLQKQVSQIQKAVSIGKKKKR